jgi:hypothetical protein
VFPSSPAVLLVCNRPEQATDRRPENALAGREPYAGTFHELFPSWDAFWAQRPDKEALPEIAEPAPLEGFLRRCDVGQVIRRFGFADFAPP